MSPTPSVLDQLEPLLAAKLRKLNFDTRFDAAWQALREGKTLEHFNRLHGALEPIRATDVVKSEVLQREHAQWEAVGLASAAKGEVAVIVLAGGMATRFGGAIKALVEVYDGLSFLDLKLRDAAHLAGAAGRSIPLLFMASFATVDALEEALRTRQAVHPASLFLQSVAPRLDEEGHPFQAPEGELPLYAPGHGDLPSALRGSGWLSKLRSQGVKHIMVSNVDNLLATIDPALLGAHVSLGGSVTVEVARKTEGDKGGAPARIDGKPQLVEGFRFPSDFDQSTLPWFNTNTLYFHIDALSRDHNLTWFAVKKQVAGLSVIQFERLMGELTRFEDSRYIEVPRSGNEGRFSPIKTPDDLEEARVALKSALQARGIKS